MCLDNARSRNVLRVPRAAHRQRQPAREKQILYKSLLVGFVVLLDLIQI